MTDSSYSVSSPLFRSNWQKVAKTPIISHIVNINSLVWPKTLGMWRHSYQAGISHDSEIISQHSQGCRPLQRAGFGQPRPAEITPIAHLFRVTQLWWSQTQNIHLLEDSRASCLACSRDRSRVDVSRSPSRTPTGLKVCSGTVI